MKTVLMGLGLAVLVGGCASAPDVGPSELARQFYGQERTYKVLEISGVSEVSMKGANITITVSAEMAPLSVIPRDPGIAREVISAVKDVVLMGEGIYTAGEVMKDLAARPATVEPTVVRPEIVTVPAE